MSLEEWRSLVRCNRNALSETDYLWLSLVEAPRVGDRMLSQLSREREVQGCTPLTLDLSSSGAYPKGSLDQISEESQDAASQRFADDEMNSLNSIQLQHSTQH